MKPHKNLSEIGFLELVKYVITEKLARKILERAEIIRMENIGPLCQGIMRLYEGQREYFYYSYKCGNKIAIRHNTILQNTKVGYRTFIYFCYLLFYQETVTTKLIRNLKISRTLILKLKKLIEIKIIAHNSTMNMLGGDKIVVEVDESLIASSKYGRGYFPDQTWIFGVVERESGKCYIQVVPDRKRATLEKVIKNIVVDATIIMSDGAKAYDNLSNLGFKHFNVIHNENFADSITGAHTQTIEGLWNLFKKKKHAEFRIAKSRVEIYCQVFYFLRNNKNMNFEDFLKILK
ncbi:hypothetical protein DMUE_0136 [Dictyocoela muelleri]|nr:hypothetical protein DMUE_0136 [Dictyocoela muelleri]